jgi:hypothetical protein
MTYRECIRQNMKRMGFDDDHAKNFELFIRQHGVPEEFLDTECSNPDAFAKKMMGTMNKFRDIYGQN